jgi:hypothetical protein
MVDPAGSEPNEPTRTAATGSIVTEFLLYRRSEGGCYYPWFEDYLTWLEGKEAHRMYHAWLERHHPGGNGAYSLVPGSCESPTSRLLATHSEPTSG